MAITVFMRYVQRDNAFGDNEDDWDTWYSHPVEWAVGLEMTDGAALFENVTREQIATMLWRISNKPEGNGSLNDFNDRNEISDWAMDAMRWAISEGLIEGYNDQTVRPQENATRGEAATIIHRFDKSNDNSVRSKKIFNVNLDEVEKIELASGSTGKRVYIDNRNDIEKIVEDINSIQYSKKETFPLTFGWGYMMTLYDKDDNIIARFLPRGELLEVGVWYYTYIREFPFDSSFFMKYLGE